MPRYSIDISIGPLTDRIFTAPLLLWRWFWHGYSYRRIKLSNSKYFAIVDQADFHELSKHDWFCDEKGHYRRAYRIDRKKGPKTFLHMHRQIMKKELNERQEELNTKLLVDHKDNNALNNKRSNLRLATREQNCRNTKNTKSKYKGVSRRKTTKRYEARININRKQIVLGYYDTDVEAAKVYDEAAKKYFREFAYLNFPPKQKPKGMKNIIKAIIKHIITNRRKR